jgi:proteic killer suppression protein
MIPSFGDASTEDVFDGRDSRAARRISPVLWPVVRRKLDMLNAAHALGDLRAPPGNRLERLRGPRSPEHRIRVNDQYRITFRFEDGDAHDVRCEDYH